MRCFHGERTAAYTNKQHSYSWTVHDTVIVPRVAVPLARILDPGFPSPSTERR